MERHGREPDEELYYACAGGRLEDARSAIRRGADPNWNNPDMNGWTALIRAARWGDTATVQYLVKETSAQVNATNDDSRTACHFAAQYGHLEIVKLLVAYGASIQLRDEDGEAPLELARKKGHQSVVDYLVKLEAPSYTKLVQRDMREGRTILLNVKVLITGPPGVGKTCIRYHLLGLPPPKGTIRRIMRTMYIELHSAMCEQPASIARLLYTHGFITDATLSMVIVTDTTTTAYAKADSLLQEVEAFVLSHETPGDVFIELLMIIREAGPTARYVASMIRKYRNFVSI